MDLKFYLNKLAKMDNIENYSLSSVYAMKDAYSKFLEENKSDPDFPELSYGQEGTTIVSSNSNNIYSVFEGDQGAIDNYKNQDMMGLSLNLSK